MEKKFYYRPQQKLLEDSISLLLHKYYDEWFIPHFYYRYFGVVAHLRYRGSRVFRF